MMWGGSCLATRPVVAALTRGTRAPPCPLLSRVFLSFLTKQPPSTSSRSFSRHPLVVVVVAGGVGEEPTKAEEEEEQAEEADAPALLSGKHEQVEEMEEQSGGSVRPGLYVVATPIGNLSDITLRALRVLKSSSVICCEDTRTTRVMLTRYKLWEDQLRKRDGAKLVSYHQHSSPSKVDAILQVLEAGAHVVSLVSDAGTPLLSDPGVPLISEAHRRGIPVVPIPGASAVVAALSASGFPSERFIFEGFLPHERTKRKKLLEELSKQHRTVAFYESPHRILHTLSDCIEIWGPDQEGFLGRELTKAYEQTVRGPLSLLLKTATAKERGEFTVLIGPCGSRANKKVRNRPRDFTDIGPSH